MNNSWALFQYHTLSLCYKADVLLFPELSKWGEDEKGQKREPKSVQNSSYLILQPIPLSNPPMHSPSAFSCRLVESFALCGRPLFICVVSFFYLMPSDKYIYILLLFDMTWKGRGSFSNDHLWYFSMILFLQVQRQGEVKLRSDEGKKKKDNLWIALCVWRKAFANT